MNNRERAGSGSKKFLPADYPVHPAIPRPRDLGGENAEAWGPGIPKDGTTVPDGGTGVHLPHNTRVLAAEEVLNKCIGNRSCPSPSRQRAQLQKKDPGKG